MIKLVKVGDEYVSSQHMEYVIDSSEDVSSLPGLQGCDAGSIAQSLDGIKYILSPSGDWEVMSGVSQSGDCTVTSDMITSALGYTPANANDVPDAYDDTQIKEDLMQKADKEDVDYLEELIGLPTIETRLVNQSFDSTQTGYVYNTVNKTGTSWSGGNSYILSVTSGEKYKISTTVIKGQAYYGVLFYNDSTQVSGVFQGSSADYTTITDAEFTIPDGVNKIIATAKAGTTTVLKKEVQVIVTPDNGILKDIAELEKIAAGKYYAKYDGTDLFVKTRYSATEDIVFNFRKRGNNNLVDFNKIYFVSNDGEFNNSITESRNLITSNTDWFSPHQVRAVSNIDGDSTGYFLTGGNHNNSGVATANCDSVTVRIDERTVSTFDGFCNNVEISWTNHIQGHNTWKSDGTGRTILDETIRLVFDGHRINVDVKNKPTESVYHSVYYGLQSVQTPFTELRFLGSGNRSAVTPTVSNDSTDLKCRKIHSSNSSGDNLIVCVDDYDYGDFSMTGSTHSAFNSNTKTYFPVLKDRSVTQASGSVYTLTGYYDFYSSN